MNSNVSKNLTITLFVLFAASSSISTADSSQYRWKNSNGDTVFSDTLPTSGEPYEVVGTSAPSKQQSESDAASDVSQEPQSSEDSDKNSVKMCRNAKARLRLLESKDKVSVRNDEGELHALSPEEKAIAQRTEKANVAVFCK